MIEKIEWVDLIRHWIKNWKQIFGIAFGASLIAAFVTFFFIDNEYKSQANLLPSEQQGFGLDLMRGGGLSSLAGTVLGGRSPEIDRFMVLLNSRTTKLRIIDEFDLINVYRLQRNRFPLDDTIKELDKNTRFDLGEEGNFIIQVWDKDPKRAQAMAEMYVAILNEFNTEISTKEAKVYREFIQKRYDKALRDIDSLRTAMIEFQARHGVFALPEQLEHYVAMMSVVTTKKIESELKLRLLEVSASRESAAYQRQKAELEAITEALDDLYNNQDPKNILINFHELPTIAADYFFLMQNLELQAEIMTFLLPIYEQARMEEIKAIPVVSVVDPPHLPDQKDRPRRSLIVLAVAFSTGFLNLVIYAGHLYWLKNQKLFDYLTN